MDGSLQEVSLSTWNRVQVLIEEFRALYALLTFRLGAIDQRLPLAAGALVALLGSSSAFSPQQRVLVLLAVPAACVWLHRTVLLHARSKEDVLRRLDEIERQINQLASQELLVFQSRHPNRKRVAGRSGFGSVRSVMVLGLLAIAAAMVFFGFEFAGDLKLLIGYASYVTLAAVELVLSTWRLSGYRYTKPPSAA